MKTLYQSIFAAFAMAACAITTQAAPLSGAIYTTTQDGTTVNGNIYTDCRDVYLNGGPQNNNFSGLPDGVYVFKVTNPSTGVLLSTDDAKYRQVLVQGERIYGVPPADKLQFGVLPSDPLHAVGTLNAANTSLPVQLWHFDETPNPGREYKVTVYRVTDATGALLVDSAGIPFVSVNGLEIISSQDNAKSDNFKCLHLEDPPPPNIPPPVILMGLKYYDINHNGVYDGLAESWGGRPVVTIQVTFTDPDHPLDPPLVATTETSEFDGSWSYIVPQGSTFTACELVPSGYIQTGPVPGDTVTNAVADSNQCWTGNVSDPNAINAITVTGLNFGNIDYVSISGAKYYDANANGVRDGTEVGIAGFKIALLITRADATTTNVLVTTDATGAWSYDTLPVGSSVTVCEVMPTGSHWMQTGPIDGATIGGNLATADDGCWDALNVHQSITGLDFGNLCLGAGGGHTLGFWSNKNGQARFDAADLAAMVALNLRNANGTAFNPTSYSGFKSWLLKATATNMSYMLSAQLSAMVLNVREGTANGFVSGSALVYAPGVGNTGVNNQFITINDLTTAANNELGLHGLVLSGSPFRAYQEALKNALDAGNNNLNFVQATACPVVYP